MDPVTIIETAPLARSAAEALVNAAGRRLRRLMAEPESAAALERAIEAGIVAMAQATEVADEDDRARLYDVLKKLFTCKSIQNDLGWALAPLLRGYLPNLDDLEELFIAAGFDPERLPGFDSRAGFQMFSGGFAAAANEQPVLRGELKTQPILSQLGLEMRDVVELIASVVINARPETISVSAEQITAENVAGVKIAFSTTKLQPVSLPPIDWESFYLSTVIERCDLLDLTPIARTDPRGHRGDETAAVRLSKVFTPLFLKGSRRRPFAAIAAVADLPRLVVLGAPGSGKSTLVNHLMVQLARRRRDTSTERGTLPGWAADERPLPVRVLLRRFAAWLPADAKADAGLVWDYVEHQLERAGCRNAFPGLRRTLTGEGGVVFFDGLDEVPEDEAKKRSLICAAVTAFAEPLAKCRIVVTCREYAYRLPDAVFREVALLAPFDLEQVQAFTRNWYRAVGGPLKGWDTARCDAEAERLSSAVRDWPHLRDLAESPLLLTLMAQMHGRTGYLPRDRADLYERTVNLLLAHWENRLVRDLRGGGAQADYHRVLRLGLGTDVLRSALEKVAFDAHERQEKERWRSEATADITDADLLLHFLEAVGSLDSARKAISYVEQRAGLLIANAPRTYHFPSRGFQEYLTARYLIQQANYDEMLRDRVRLDLPWWREVFLLAAGASRETPRVISDLVDQLLPRLPEVDSVTPEAADQASLAAQALIESRFTERVTKEDPEGSGRFTATLERVRSWIEAAVAATEALAFTERAYYQRLLSALDSQPRGMPAITDMGVLEDLPLSRTANLGEFAQLVPWAVAFLRRCELDGTTVIASRAIGAGRWLLRARLPAALQGAYETAPEALILAVEGEVQGADLDRSHEELRRHEFSLDLDLLIVIDDRPYLAERLDRMSKSGGQWVAWPASERGFPSLAKVFRRHLSRQDVFELHGAVRGRQVIGRTEVISDLSRRLIAGQAVGILGLRKVGKTTVVRAVTDRLDPISAQLSLMPTKRSQVGDPSSVRARVAWFDASRACERNLDALALRLRRILERRLAVENLVPQAGPTSQSEFTLLDQLLENVLHASEVPLVLVLDEYDLLFEGSSGEPAVRDLDQLFRILRAHAQETARLALVVIGRDPTFFEHPEMGGRTNPMLGWFVPRWLGPMPRPEADLLLAKLGRRVALDTGPETQELGFQWTGGHPLLHRLFGSSLLERSRFEAAGSESHTATDAFCNHAIDIFLERHDVMTFCRDVCHLLSARYPEAHQLLGELSCEADDDAVEVIAAAGGWHRPAARVLRDFGLLLGTATAPWIPGILRWYLTNFESWQRRRA